MSASKTIHALIARVGMRDEDYRAMLWDRFRASSSKDLTESQATELVASLHALLPADQIKRHPRPQIAHGTRKRFEKFDGRHGMATGAQMRMLEASWVQRSRASTLPEKQTAFVEFVKRRFKIERLEWIGSEDVGRILRAIQSVDPDATPKARTRRKPSLQTSLKGA